MRKNYLHLLEGVLFILPLLFASCGNGDNALEEIINGGGSMSIGTYLRWNGTDALVATAIPSDAKVMSASETTWNGTYVVIEDITINDDVTIGGDVHLIILDGKTLSLATNKKIEYNDNTYELNIYSQSIGDGAGKLVVKTTTDSDWTGYPITYITYYPIGIKSTLNIHSGIVEATATGDGNRAICAQNMNVYGASVTAEGTGQGIWVEENLSVYGGVVKGIGTVSSDGPAGAGIVASALLTVYKGEVTGLGGSAVSGNNAGGTGISTNQIIFKDGTITGTGGNGYGGDGTETEPGSGSGGWGIAVGHGENTISGGTITATGGEGGTGTKTLGGRGLYCAEKLVVSGGTIKATGANGTKAGNGYGIYVYAGLEYKGGDIEANGGTGANGIGGTITNKSGASINVGRRANSTGAWTTENVANDDNVSNFDRYMAFPLTIM